MKLAILLASVVFDCCARFALSVECPEALSTKFATEYCPTHDVMDYQLSRANDSKAQYFTNMAEVLPGFQIFGDSGLRVPTTAKVCFMGDSTVQELSVAWQRIAPDSSVALHTTSCGYLSVPKLLGPPPSKDSKPTTEPQAIENFEEVGRARVSWLVSTGCQAVFVGGIGLNCLSRRENRPPEEAPPGSLVSSFVPPKATSGLAAHKAFAEAFMADLASLAANQLQGVPVVFVGSPVVEAEVLNLYPPLTRDYSDEFHDFALSKLWAFGETESFSRLYGTAAARRRRLTRLEEEEEEEEGEKISDEQLARARSLSPHLDGTHHYTKPGSRPTTSKANFHMFDLSKVHLSCPGVRCDGIHINKPDSDTHCPGTPGLLDRPLISFLEQTGILDQWTDMGLFAAGGTQQHCLVTKVT